MGLFLVSQVGNSSNPLIVLTDCLGVLTTFIIDPAGSIFLVFSGPILIIAFLAIVYLVISDSGEEELQEYVIYSVINYVFLSPMLSAEWTHAHYWFLSIIVVLVFSFSSYKTFVIGRGLQTVQDFGCGLFLFLWMDLLEWSLLLSSSGYSFLLCSSSGLFVLIP